TISSPFPYTTLFRSAYFENKGMTLHRRRTFYIDLSQNEQRLFQAIHSRRRSYIRAASKQLRVEVCKEPDIELFTRWHRAAFERRSEEHTSELQSREN